MNDKSKKQTKALNEHFVEELQSSTSPDIVKQSEPGVSQVLSKIDRIYREVYGEPVPADKMSLYYKSLGSADFDEGAFKRRVSLERKMEFEDLIKSTYIDVLKRPPTPTELNKYLDLYVFNNMKTKQDLEFILRLDVETAINSEKASKGLAKKTNAEEYKTYKMIISVYTDVLERQPSPTELEFYNNLVKEQGLDVQKLRAILVSSREYDILQKNQNNTVHGELEWNITEKQLEIVIGEIYNAVFNEFPDETTYKYLRGKFVAFNLDEEQLTRFVRRLKEAEVTDTASKAITTTKPPISTTQTIDDVALVQTKTNKELFSDVIRVPNERHPLDPPKQKEVDPRDRLFDPISDQMQQGNDAAELNATIRRIKKSVPNPVVGKKELPYMTNQGYNKQDVESFADPQPVPIATPGPMSMPQTQSVFQPTPGPLPLTQFGPTPGPIPQTQFVSTPNPMPMPNTQPTPGLMQALPTPGPLPMPQARSAAIPAYVPTPQPKAPTQTTPTAQLANEFTRSSQVQPTNNGYINTNKDLKLIPELQWQIPMRNPPVCHPVNSIEYKPNLSQTALLGTLLSDAEQTTVGSIMPDFQYKELV